MDAARTCLARHESRIADDVVEPAFARSVAAALSW
jgi:hypothetical protein